MIEKALKSELCKIEELQGKVFPTNAPKVNTPYVTYIKTYYKVLKTTVGITNDRESSFMINILCDSYSQLQDTTKLVVDLLLTFPLRYIGDELNNVFIEDFSLNNVSELYENELNMYRTVIDIKICYKEGE